jgi:hypothetical protein
MSLEVNKHNVELKSQWESVQLNGSDYDNLDQEKLDLENLIKSRLRDSIDILRANAQYDVEASPEEKTQIDNWYSGSLV